MLLINTNEQMPWVFFEKLDYNCEIVQSQSFLLYLSLSLNRPVLCCKYNIKNNEST